MPEDRDGLGTVVGVSELPELPPVLDTLRDHVLRHSVKRGEFTLKSGARSTWFLDTKQTACRADLSLIHI